MEMSGVSSSSSSRREKSLVKMVEEATARLERMDISCRDVLRDSHPIPPNPDLHLLQLQLTQLQHRLVKVIHQREDQDVIFQRAMQYAAAKGTANAVLHTLFDQASAGKYQVLEQWYETGVIPTRDGLKHWRLDLREIRNEIGASILHVAVDASIARVNLKVKCVELLVDRLGFDVNVRDAFGRTPLHVAAMAGYAEVTQALLTRGADATLRDRAGLTPLSVVRTLSKPPEDVVQLLAAAESEAARQLTAASHQVTPETAITSALFLRVVRRFVSPAFEVEFTKQTDVLLNALLNQQDGLVAFDDLMWKHVPLLFEMCKSTTRGGDDGTPETRSLVRLDSLFRNEMYWDSYFVDELKVEAAAYELSLVTATAAASRGGATWEGFIVKLILGLKAASASQPIHVASGCDQQHTTNAIHEVSDSQGSTVSEHTDNLLRSPSGASSPHRRSPLYADRTSTSHVRQAWHYAVLFKASSQPFPGFLSVKKGQSTVTCSEDVSRFFPLHDRLIIGSTEYHCVSYDSSSQVIQLDREYEGPNAVEIKAYLAGSNSSLLPPYIAAKRMWEREPGNKYEDHMSNEQELFQDYQFLDPDSEYEVAVKLGPVPTAREAKSIVEEWKRQSRRLFEEKKCQSGLPSCEHYCPQRSGHSLCVETMAAIGRAIAKERLGRATYSKQLKPRASLQKYQDLFLCKAPWPGSPSTAVPHFFSAESAPPDFT